MRTPSCQGPPANLLYLLYACSVNYSQDVKSNNLMLQLYEGDLGYHSLGLLMDVPRSFLGFLREEATMLEGEPVPPKVGNSSVELS